MNASLMKAEEFTLALEWRKPALIDRYSASTEKYLNDAGSRLMLGTEGIYVTYDRLKQIMGCSSPTPSRKCRDR